MVLLPAGLTVKQFHKDCKRCSLHLDWAWLGQASIGVLYSWGFATASFGAVWRSSNHCICQNEPKILHTI